MIAYQKYWRKGYIPAFCAYLRDVLVFFLPLHRLPRWLRIALIGVDAKFIFIVHPRRKEDVYIAWPFITPFRAILGKGLYSLMKYLPPTILDTIKTPNGIDGVVISSTWLPQLLIRSRKGALKEARRCLSFSAKISSQNGYVGLGAWWPFLTKRGEAVQNFSKSLKLQITTGYCATLCSLFLAIKQISQISNTRFDQLRVLILGVGKMGSLLARILTLEGIGMITVFDKNPRKQERLVDTLNRGLMRSVVFSLASEDLLKSALVEHDICVCTTSNLQRLFKPAELPEGILVLDDSRPEAIPRIYNKQRGIFVLEGGLFRVRGANLRYDFGFGNNHDEVFGCLAEAYILASDRGKTLTPTVGDLELSNFYRMLLSLERVGVETAALRSGSFHISSEEIAEVIRSKRASRGTKLTVQQTK